MTNKNYPEDFTPEQQEIIKDTVIERIKRLPDSLEFTTQQLKGGNRTRP